MDQNIQNQVGLFTIKLSQLMREYYTTKFSNLAVPKLEVKFGKKYAKIIKVDNQRSVHSFINLSNGDILMAASWNAPAKHARGNIFDANCGVGTAVTVYGARYL
jgi:hypothetical protein